MTYGTSTMWYENGKLLMKSEMKDTLVAGRVTPWLNDKTIVWYRNGTKKKEFMSKAGGIDSTTLCLWDSLGHPLMINGKRLTDHCLK